MKEVNSLIKLFFVIMRKEVKNMLIDSKLEIQEEFNECPGREVIEDEILGLAIKYVDLDEANSPYWRNDRATMVFLVKKTVHPMLFTRLVHHIRPDEFDWLDRNGKYVVRLWWD
jgi:hypothetical protein